VTQAVTGDLRCSRATSSVEKSEELAQGVFLRAWRSLSQLQDLSKFRAWLCSIARSTVQNWFRDRRRDVVGRAVPLDAVADKPSEESGPEEAAMIQEQRAVALEFPKIDRRPATANYQWGKLDTLAHYDPNSTNPFQVDLRRRDLTGLDLTGRLDDLLHANFDDRTKWPAQMPPGYDYQRIMELGKNPGLGIRALHKQGITGRGVGIAICDQPLLVDHQEYRDRLRLYEEINIRPEMEAQMHGPAVASIAVGKTVGVAPEADLYYIGEWNGDWNDTGFTWNLEYLARGVQRILEINEQLPAAQKIRVISISVGWDTSQKGYQQITEAVNKAKPAGLLVICSSVEEVHGFAFHGLGRSAPANPDDVNSCEPGSWWANAFYQGKPFASGSNRLLVPMDARTTASPTAASEYVFYAQGGWSWSIPYIAGVYALAAQVEPKITPDRFWALALRTGRTFDLHRGGQERKFGPILDPAGVVAALRQGELSDKEAVAAALAKYYPSGTRQSHDTDAYVPKDRQARRRQRDPTGRDRAVRRTRLVCPRQGAFRGGQSAEPVRHALSRQRSSLGFRRLCAEYHDCHARVSLPRRDPGGHRQRGGFQGTGAAPQDDGGTPQL
jgi:hypothetical protein